MSDIESAVASLPPQRTVRHALKKLDAANAVEESVYLMDARKSNYRIADTEDSQAETATV